MAKRMGQSGKWMSLKKYEWTKQMQQKVVKEADFLQVCSFWKSI